MTAVLVSGCISEATLNSQAFSHAELATEYRQACMSQMKGWEQSKKRALCDCYAEGMRARGLTVREAREIGQTLDQVRPWVQKIQLDCTARVMFDGQIPSTKSPKPVATESRSLAIRWEGVSDLIAGTISFQQGSSGTMSITLPNNEGACQGAYRIGSDRAGIWSVACTNNLTASGIYTAFGVGKGSSGEGTDSKGRRVQFTIGGRQR